MVVVRVTKNLGDHGWKGLSCAPLSLAPLHMHVSSGKEGGNDEERPLMTESPTVVRKEFPKSAPEAPVQKSLKLRGLIQPEE